ncbi:MAG: glycosyltransferase [Myxococcales bacterium]|nr:glycosyltransferase [Myxococcales bacterium]
MRLPRISLVVPSLDQGRYLEEALRSVLEQGYPELELIAMDGGSKDGSVQVLERYASRLAHWESQKDGGQYVAVNRGFARSSGEVMGWLNSDDKHTPWCLSVVGELFAAFPEVQWLTTLYPLYWDERGRAVHLRYQGGYERESFLRGANLPGRGWYARDFIQQESTFWRRSLWESAGGRLDESLSLAADFELWVRFFKLAELVAVATPLAGFRRHSEQKTARELERYSAEAEQVLLSHGGKPYRPWESLLRRSLWTAGGGRPLRKLPRWLGQPLARSGVLGPTRVCVWNGAGWEIAADYVV